MQFRIFFVPACAPEPASEELNRFLRGHRIIGVNREYSPASGSGGWTFCVEYLDSTGPGTSLRLGEAKVDYRQILDTSQFAVFSSLRAARKRQCEAEAIPAYTIFTNEQLAQMVQRKVADKQALTAIEGIGASRAEKYGALVIPILEKAFGNETKRQSDGAGS